LPGASRVPRPTDCATLRWIGLMAAHDDPRFRIKPGTPRSRTGPPSGASSRKS